MRQILSFTTMLACMLASTSSGAQVKKIEYRDRLGDSTVLENTAIKPLKEKKPKSLKSEISGGLSINSNGWGAVIDYGRYFGADRFGNNPDRFHHVHVFQLEAGEIKHPKEIRTGGSFLGLSLTPGSYVLGKINNFYHIKLGYGQRRMLAGKPESGTVSIHWTNIGGFTLGMAKPYYLNLINLGEGKYTTDNEMSFVNPGYIQNASGFSKGFDEMKYIPGLYLKEGLHFDFANRRKLVMAIDAGVNMEYYFQKVEQMVGQDPKSFFLNLYAVIQIGKRS